MTATQDDIPLPMLKLSALILSVYTAGAPGLNELLPRSFAGPIREFHLDLTRGAEASWSRGLRIVRTMQRLDRVAADVERVMR